MTAQVEQVISNVTSVLTAAVDNLDDARSSDTGPAPHLLTGAYAKIQNARRDLLALRDMLGASSISDAQIADAQISTRRVDEQVVGVGNGRAVKGTAAACERVAELVKRAENAVNLNVDGGTIYGPYEAVKAVKGYVDRAGAFTELQKVIEIVRTMLKTGDVNGARQAVGLAPVAPSYVHDEEQVDPATYVARRVKQLDRESDQLRAIDRAVRTDTKDAAKVANDVRAALGMVPANYSGVSRVTSDPWVTIAGDKVRGSYEAVKAVQRLIEDRSELVRICNADYNVPDSVRQVVGAPLPPRPAKHLEDELIDAFAEDVKQGLRKIRANQVGYMSRLQGRELVDELRRALSQNRPLGAVACLAYMYKSGVSTEALGRVRPLHLFRVRELADKVLGECRSGVYVAPPKKLAQLVGECIEEGRNV